MIDPGALGINANALLRAFFEQLREMKSCVILKETVFASLF
ncbi:hypothetical protein [Paenibacillus odorifer]|nr:hypothetical protein [Paenibacillus odorifer]